MANDSENMLCAYSRKLVEEKTQFYLEMDNQAKTMDTYKTGIVLIRNPDLLSYNEGKKVNIKQTPPLTCPVLEDQIWDSRKYL